ncbi:MULTISPECIES: hypothetical protein [Pseudomonadaceae]|uniref:Uncharacterized protein n=1 Tax=Aquipseudomonas alcaligenes (strain ATCC 14909 / DSM 50342 / CCUG 1425 / JCM 20561 / NBRC 14159 / NCIMB 9945 / NCTC 10367 / 1577) TaxID=1215092 RepID=U2ZL87_AQUA1|nr:MULTISPECIES: hypothetical protein [Pseudomonas]MWV15194.1 hypothetical protein [Pseudomonas sp. L-22-4S-12]GAD61802.1 hypothetical protein PA6_008_00050 [Pseudomonas alcaligenes NBRC 14159]
MNQNIEDLIRDIWQSENPIRRTEELSQALQDDTKAVIREVLKNIQARATARSNLTSGSVSNIADDASASVEPRSNQNSLLLLYFAMYDADSLSDVSRDSRERCLKSWSEQTGFSIDVVREAVILGQNGLRPLISASSSNLE